MTTILLNGRDPAVWVRGLFHDDHYGAMLADDSPITHPAEGSTTREAMGNHRKPTWMRSKRNR